MPRRFQSKFATLLHLRYIDGRDWQLDSKLIYHSAIAGRIQVPVGFITDFASVPRVFWRVLPPDDYGPAAVVHDWAYRSHALTRLVADQVYREALAVLEAPRWKQWVMYWGVRVGGSWAYHRDRAAF